MQALVSHLSSTEIPKNFQEAWKNDQWKKAIMEEKTALEKNGIWEIVQKPEDKSPVGCKWVFTIKYKSDGSIEHYKARLVAKALRKPMVLIFRKHLFPLPR